jgi:hypothetical protein
VGRACSFLHAEKRAKERRPDPTKLTSRSFGDDDGVRHGDDVTPPPSDVETVTLAGALAAARSDSSGYETQYSEKDAYANLRN